MERLVLEGTAAAVRPLALSALPSTAPDERLPEPLAAAMRERGYVALTPVQEAVLSAERAGRDLSISSRTGSGKTVALGFVLAPALLERAGEPGLCALVIVPTRELAMQVQLELRWLFARAPGLRVECVTGGTSPWQERARFARRPQLVVGTPGRLLDHIKSGVLDCGEVAELVLDEADQMLDMGFRDELDAIVAVTPPTRRTHMVSATFPAGIRALAARHQREPLVIEGSRPGEAHADIEHVAHLVTPRNRYAALVNLLLLAEGERTLVFVNTRADAARLADQLGADGFRAMALSGELQQSQRTATLAAFRSGAISVLVATDVAARGLDVPEVATVVHAGPPADGEAYVHRSGRTGRAGKKGRSVLLAPAGKERALRRTLAEAGLRIEWQPLPDAGSVQKELQKRERRRIFEAVDAEPGPSAEDLEFARRLVAARDPERIVAVLIGERRAKGSGEAREVGSPLAPSTSTSTSARDERPAQRPRIERGTRFEINWGAAGGATPQRILAHLCRRGGIPGHLVGAIRLGEHSATFEIAHEAARSFESRVRTRDARDPGLFIVRAR